MNFFYKSSAFSNNFFSEIMLESFGCGLYTSLYGMYDTTESINNAFAISSLQKPITAECFYDYFDKCPTLTIALQRIALRTDYGINADTKLTMFGIYSAAMNVAGTFFFVVTIYKRVLNGCRV